LALAREQCNELNDERINMNHLLRPFPILALIARPASFFFFDNQKTTERCITILSQDEIDNGKGKGKAKPCLGIDEKLDRQSAHNYLGESPQG